MDKITIQIKVQKMNVNLMCKLGEYERKDMCLTPGGLVDMRNHSQKKVSHKKSAEAVVVGKTEGLNNLYCFPL